jgi:DNA-binding NarL/FixJ family response regulator
MRATEAGGIEDLVRLLVQRSSTGDEQAMGCPQEPDTDTERIVLDVNVDGARYLLVRVPEPKDSYPQLTPREQEIARMVALGHPNNVVADALNISTWTLHTHLRRIFAKLGVASRAAMIARMSEMAGSQVSTAGGEETPRRVDNAS